MKQDVIKITFADKLFIFITTFISIAVGIMFYVKLLKLKPFEK